MMAVAIVAVYTWQMWRIVLAFAIGVSPIPGMRLSDRRERLAARRIPLEPKAEVLRRKAG